MQMSELFFDMKSILEDLVKENQRLIEKVGKMDYRISELENGKYVKSNTKDDRRYR